ncbi:FMN reductase [Clostridia bacterium]|nr:FMN reductase [Clostridia bacterium]
MKVVLINGSPNAEGCTYTALREVEQILNDEGIETQLFQVGKKPVSGCIACRSCFKTGHCFMDDSVKEVAALFPEHADGLILGSPVYYATMSGQISSFADRLFFSSMKERRFDYKVAAGIVSCRRGGAVGAFDDLNKYFLMNNMYVVGSQYWNMVHGSKPEEVKQDLEGLQTMRRLGKNMAFLLRAFQAAKQLEVKEAVLEEEHIFTNFIQGS